MLDRHERRTEGLRSWAAGILAQEAAVELLIAFGHGRLLDDPWVRPGGFGSHWFDTARAASEGGHLSGGEKRVLAIAASLISAEHPVDLGDAITGLDPDALGLVLDALARAGGQTAGPKITPADDEKRPEMNHDESKRIKAGGTRRRQSRLHLVGTEQTPAEPPRAADSDQSRTYIDGVMRMAEEIRVVPFEDVFTVDEEPVTLDVAEVGILRKVSDEYPLAQATISATALERPIAFDIDSSTISHIVGDSVRWIWIETLRGRQYALSDGFDSESRQLISWATRAVSGGWSPRAVEFSMTSAGLEATT